MNRFVLPVLLFAGVVFAQVDTAWVRHHQYSASYSAQSVMTTRTTAFDPWGNILVGAYGQYDTANYDIIVLKYSRSGSLCWSASYDAGNTDYCYGISSDEEGSVYATGSAYTGSSATMLTVKWDADGNLLWARQIQGDTASYYNRGTAVVARNGAVYISGQVFHRVSGPDFALAKLDAATGAVAWLRLISRSAETGQYEQAVDVVAGSAGRVFVAGQTHDSLLVSGYDASVACYDSAGNQAWVQHYSGVNSTETIRRLCVRDNLVAAVGSSYTGLNNYDALLLAYSTAGAFQWSALYDNPSRGSDYAYDVGIDATGNVVACGTSYTSSGMGDMLTLKYSSVGTQLWARLYDCSAGSDAGYSLSLDNAGNVMVGGYVTASTPPIRAASIKYSSTGSLGWVFSFMPPGSSSTNYFSSVAASGADVYLAGMTYWGFPNYSDPTVIRLREIPDVGAHAIIAPLGTVTPGIPVTPQAEVRNYSLVPASFGCRFQISDGYADSTPVTLGSGASTSLSFANWTPSLPGYWVVRCSTDAVFDYDRLNDSALARVYVPGPPTDVGVRQFASPAGNVRRQATIVPAARWHNFGTTAATFTAYMFLNKGATRIYSHQQTISDLQPDGYDTLLSFPGWVADDVGYYVVRCSTVMAGDSNPTNDTLSLEFAVINQPSGEWQRMADLPSMPSGRPVNKGGALTSDNMSLYALKGNKTNEVYSYDIGTGRWRQLPNLPDNASQRAVAAGSALATDGSGRLYVARGNKTSEFYRYDSMLGWEQLADVPPGSSRKTLKGGTGMEFAISDDTGYVYLLKGSSTAEFYRYNTVHDSWEALSDAPAGTSAKAKYADGSGLAYDRVQTVSCLKAKYNEVFEFDLSSLSWQAGQQNVPLLNSLGKRKKVKKGGAAAWADGMLTVLKGGNTAEFWHLDGTDSTWREFPSVPPGDQGRKVKDGGGLEFVQGSYYVLKGAKTCELWRFTPAAGDGPTLPTGLFAAPVRRLVAAPNPARDRVYIAFGLVSKLPCMNALYDGAGRLCRLQEVPSGQGGFWLTTAGLPPGVYLLTTNDACSRASTKLVLTE